MNAFPPSLQPFTGEIQSAAENSGRLSHPSPIHVSHARPQVGLTHLWQLLRQRKWTFLISTTIGCILATLLAVTQHPTYVSRAQIEVQDLNANFLNISNAAPVTDAGATQASSDIQTQIKLLQTNSLVDRTVHAMMSEADIPLDNQQAPGPAKFARRPSLLDRLLGKSETQSWSYRRELESLGHSVEVRAMGQSRIIEIAVSANNPELAAAFVNTLCNSFIEQNVDNRWKVSQKTGEWLDQVLENSRRKLAESESNLQSFAQKHGLVVTDEKHQQAADENLDQLEQELSHAQTDRIAKQSRFEIAKAAMNEQAPEVLDDPALRDYQSKLADLNRQKAELSTTYTNDHPKIERLSAQIASLTAALKAQRQEILARIQADYEQSRRRETLLGGAYQNQYQHLSGQSQSTIQLAILQREVDSNRQLYDAMLQRAKDATVLTALKASNIRLVDPALPPNFAVSPKLAFNNVIGLFAGIFVAGLYVWIRESSNEVFRQPGEIASLLSLPELGVVFHVPKRWKTNFKRQTNKMSIPAAAPSSRAQLTEYQNGSSLMRDCFRHVLASILLPNGPAATPKTLVVASAGAGEGKTTLCANLGMALAEAGRRVLLVDGDVRRPRLHDLFGLSKSPGLVNAVLQPEPSLPPNLNGVLPTKVPRLFVLPAGDLHDEFSHFVHSTKLQPLLEAAAEQFDLVIVDTPPVLLIPDARFYGSIADGVLLVARAGVTTRTAVAALSQRLASDGSNILGVVLNDWNPSLNTYGYKAYTEATVGH